MEMIPRWTSRSSISGTQVSRPTMPNGARSSIAAVRAGRDRDVRVTCESCGGIWVEGEDVDDVPETIDFKAASKELAGFFKSFAQNKKK